MVRIPSPRPDDRSNSNLLAPRSMATQCVECPPLAPCPKCSKHQICQQSVPPSCAQCPINACVLDPSYDHKHSNAGSIGGAVGGMMAALAVAGLLFWLWRRRRQQSKDIMRRARLDAKMRTATAERFRPGGAREKSLIKANAAAASDGDASSAARGRGASVSPSSALRSDSAGGDNMEQDEDELDESDVEWTELREDGLTAYRNKPGQDGAVVQDAALLKRQSVGAATHLSRITEGAEDDEVSLHNYRRNHDSQRVPRKSTIAEEVMADVRPGSSGGSDHHRGHSSSTSIGNELSRTRSRKSHVGNGVNPFLDGTEAASVVSGRSNSSFTDGGSARASSGLEHGIWSAPTNLEAPSRVHRPVGAPLVDLKGKPKSPSYASSSTSGSTRTPLSPISMTHPTAAPNRPSRNADLNLRLADGTEPGKIGDDLLKKGRPGTGLSQDSGGMRSTTDSMQERRAEMYEGSDYPTELANSTAYGQRKGGVQDDRNSIMTTNTTSTVGTMDYVLSAPQIISPMLADGAKRMQLKQGKAHLVRSLSAIRREQEERKDARKAGNGGHSDAASSAGGSDGDPFGDMHSYRANTSRSVSSAGQNGRAGVMSDSSSEMSVPLGLSPSEHPSALPVFTLNDGQSYLGSGGRPQSSMSSLSLPFIDQRPMLQPEERSPTDAVYSRASMATLGSLLPARNSAISIGSYASSSGAGGGGNANARAAQRHSQTSIAGLSVFDEIPFHIGHEGEGNHVNIAMPDREHSPLPQSKERHDSQGSSHTVEIMVGDSDESARQSAAASPSSSPLFHTLQVGGDADASGQSASSPFHDSYEATETLEDGGGHAHQQQEQQPRSSTGSRSSTRSHAPALRDVDGGEHDDDDDDDEDDDDERSASMSSMDASGKVPTSEDFDQIRLRHELDSYPFQVDITPSPR